MCDVVDPEDIYSRTYIEEYMKKGKPTKELVSIYIIYIIYIYIYNILTSTRVLSPPQDLNETVTSRWCHYLIVICCIIGGPAWHMLRMWG